MTQIQVTIYHTQSIWLSYSFITSSIWCVLQLLVSLKETKRKDRAGIHCLVLPALWVASAFRNFQLPIPCLLSLSAGRHQEPRAAHLAVGHKGSVLSQLPQVVRCQLSKLWSYRNLMGFLWGDMNLSQNWHKFVICPTKNFQITWNPSQPTYFHVRWKLNCPKLPSDLWCQLWGVLLGRSWSKQTDSQ